MNIQVMTPSRKKPAVGDIFVFRLKQFPSRYWFGRVARTDSSVGPFKNTILIYLYNLYSEDKAKIPALPHDRLLVPPIHTNRLPWSRGYFETVTKRPIPAAELLPKHTFKDYPGRYFDEYSNPVAQPAKPLGEFGLHSYQTIDDAISKALEIPLFKE